MTTTCFYGPLSPSCSDLVVITISHIDTINTRSRGVLPYWSPIGPLLAPCSGRISGSSAAIVLQPNICLPWAFVCPPKYMWWTYWRSLKKIVGAILATSAQVTGKVSDDRIWAVLQLFCHPNIMCSSCIFRSPLQISFTFERQLQRSSSTYAWNPAWIGAQ